MGSFQQSLRQQPVQEQEPQPRQVLDPPANDVGAGQQQGQPGAPWWQVLSASVNASIANAQAAAAAPAEVSSPLYPDQDDVDPTFGADVSSAVGEAETSYNHGTTLSTINDLTDGGVPLNVFYDGESWRVSTHASGGGVSNTSHVEVDENGRTTHSRTELGEGDIVYQEVAVGESVTNDRWQEDDDSLAYDMTRILDTDSVDVVGMQDKLNLNAGFETDSDRPISIAHDEGVFTGHDVYHFRDAEGENSDEARDAELAPELADVDGVTDLSVESMLAMPEGSGFAFIDQTGNTTDTSLTGRRQFGPLSGSLTVGFGSGDRDLQQTMVARTGATEVTISLMQADGDRSASQFGLGIGTPERGGLESTDIEATFGTEVEDVGSTEVEFKIDLATEEGRAQFEAFSTTGLLPGADQLAGDESYLADQARYQELAGELEAAEPGSQDYHRIQQEIFEAAGEMNNVFMQRDTFREEFAGVEGAEYTRWRNENEQTVTHSASLFALEMSRVGSVEREWDELLLDGSNVDFEAGWFQDTEFTEGNALVVASPNQAPGIALGTSSRADLAPLQTMYEAGALPEGLLDPELAQAVFEDGLEDFNDGGAQLTIALTDENMALLAEHGGDLDALLDGVGREDIWERPRNQDLEDNLFGDISEDIYKEGQSGRYSEEELRAFHQEMGLEWGRWDGSEGTSIREQFQNTTMEDFENMSPLMREVFIEVRATDLAVNDRNPWEALTLVSAIEDPEERAHMMRELFQRIEDTNLQFDPYSREYEYSDSGILGGDGANTASFLLLQHMTDVGAELTPAQRAQLMSGVRIDLVDQRASDWASDRLLDPMLSGEDREAVLDGFVDEHVNWSIDNSSYDQLSDNFQAAALAGGPQMVEGIVDRIGEGALIQLLHDTYQDDPRRLAIYGVALAGTPYADLVEQTRAGQCPTTSP
jgi:hypothetical protein